MKRTKKRNFTKYELKRVQHHNEYRMNLCFSGNSLTIAVGLLDKIKARFPQLEPRYEVDVRLLIPSTVKIANKIIQMCQNERKYRS